MDGQFCKLPFTYQGKEYNHCIINYPDNHNSRYVPKCLTHAEQWSACVQPTDAIIDFITTRKNRNVNTVSRNGGTLLWIFGRSKIKFLELLKQRNWQLNLIKVN